MQSQREQSTPSPNMQDITENHCNDSTFIGDINELNVGDKQQMKIYVKELKFKSKAKGIGKTRQPTQNSHRKAKSVAFAFPGNCCASVCVGFDVGQQNP